MWSTNSFEPLQAYDSYTIGFKIGLKIIFKLGIIFVKGNVISRFNKVKDKFSMESIYPTTHEAVLSILNANAFNNQLVSGHVSNTPSLIYDQNENTYEQVDIKIDLFSNDLMKRSSKNNFDVFEAAVFQN